MACLLVYVILSDFRYDKDPAKDLSELTETEIAKETVPMIPAQTDNTTDYEETEKLKDSESEKDEYGWTGKKAEEEKDDNGAGLELENRKQKILEKEFLKYSVK